MELEDHVHSGHRAHVRYPGFQQGGVMYQGGAEDYPRRGVGRQADEYHNNIESPGRQCEDSSPFKQTDHPASDEYWKHPKFDFIVTGLYSSLFICTKSI